MNSELQENLVDDIALTGTDTSCPACGSRQLIPFYEAQNAPVYGTALTLSKKDALDSPLGDIMLVFCEQCGLITNAAYEPESMSEPVIYEDQQGFSPTFDAFLNELVHHLIRKYHLRGKNIVEIGCGKGDFLKLICKIGRNKGVGIDPLATSDRIGSEIPESLVFVPEYYSEGHGRYRSDIIICRHTLEHIPSPAEFLNAIRRSIADRLETVVFFEVPDVTRILTEVAFWDIYYEHCSYFSPGSIARLFKHCGFELIDLRRDYEDQYLLVEAKPVRAHSQKVLELEENPQNMEKQINSFSVSFHRILGQWKQRLQTCYADGKRIVIWGSGSKCVAFLTSLAVKDEIEYVVDINLHRQGKFIPGSGKKIMSPEFLKSYKPDLVIVMNPIYFDEINKMTREMNVSAELVTV